VSGRDDGCFEGINLQGVVFAARGSSVAYPVQVGPGWAVVWDGSVGPSWDGVGPPVLSPDGRRIAYPAEDELGWRVVLDHEPGPVFDALLAGSLTFDDKGSRLAYAGRLGDSVHVVVNNAVGRGWDGAGSITFGPSGEPLVFVARLADKVAVVTDGEVDPSHDEIGDLAVWTDVPAYAARDDSAWCVVYGARVYGSLEGARDPVFSDDGTLWFVGKKDGREAVFRDGVSDGWHDAVTEPVFSAAAERWGYISRDGDSSSVHVSGKPAVREAWADDLVISPDGSRFVYVAEGLNGPEVVMGTDRYPFPIVIEKTLQFSTCGHWAALIGIPDGKELRVFVDGIGTEQRLDWDELIRLVELPDAVGALHRWVGLAASASGESWGCMP
jgi:hypothetical protein